MADNINTKVKSATSWSLITEIVAKLIAPVTNMILARLLTPEAFGSVATITMIISFADIFTDAGFQKYIVQHNFDNERDLCLGINVAFWSNFLLSVISVLIIVFFRHPIAELVGEPNLAAGIAVASFSIILLSFSSIQMAVYRRRFDFKTLFFVRIVTSLMPLVVTVPLALYFRSYWALVIGTLAMNFVQAVILTCKSTWKPSFMYSKAKFYQMFSFTAWTLLESIAIWLTSYIGTFIVGRALNSYYLGLYKTSMSTVNAYMGIATSAITPVLFSALSRYQDNDSEFKETYFKFQKIVAIFLMPMGVGLFVFRNLATEILLGEKWLEASNFIGLWSLMSALTMTFSYFSSEVYRSKGKPKISLLSQLIHLAFLIPAIMISVTYGFRALYISRSLIRFQGIIVGLLFMHFMFGIKFQKIIQCVAPSIISAVFMGIAAELLRNITPNIVWQFIVIAISAVLYFGLLLLFPSTRNDVLGFLKIGMSKLRLKRG